MSQGKIPNIQNLINAIREGSTRIEQCRHHFLLYGADGQPKRGCALGMAAVFTGQPGKYTSTPHRYSHLLEDLGLSPSPCIPSGPQQDQRLIGTIIELNDQNRLSPEEICNYLQQFAEEPTLVELPIVLNVSV